MIEVKGKQGIVVKVVLHSISESGKEIITFLRDYPRIVHAEDLKHRQHSNSAASSRAIPSAKMAEQLTGMPVSFGKNQGGMQAGGEHNELIKGRFKYDPWTGEEHQTLYTPQEAWAMAKQDAAFWSDAFSEAGYHKQCYNRLTEAHQMIRVLTTTTETANFYWLRNDEAADPTLQEVARCMKEAHEQSTPQVLKPGQWHLPFVESLLSSDDSGLQYFYEEVNHVGTTNYMTLDNAIKVACARCAATSFRNTDYDLAKSLQVYDRLVNGDKVHAGALEHCGTPMQNPAETVDEGAYLNIEQSVNLNYCTSTWEPGVSHADRDGKLWSGNFCEYVQYRKLVPNECYKGA